MQKALEILREDLGTIRAGRANAALIENIRMKVYGGSQELSLKELATISVSPPQAITVTPFDVSIIEEIERGLLQANLGLSVAQDGEIIRVKLPALTEERRQEFIKLAKTKSEGVRVMIRQIRHEVINNVRRWLAEKEIAEDEKFRLEKEIQKITDEVMEEVEGVLKRKIGELETV